MSRENALELMGKIMEQNARDAAFATSSVIDGLERQLDELGESFLALYFALKSIPPMIRSVYIDDLLIKYDFAAIRAEDRRVKRGGYIG